MNYYFFGSFYEKAPNRALLLFFSLFSIVTLFAQSQQLQWDIIPQADLQMTVYEPDSSAEAVVLADYGSVNVFSSTSEYGYTKYHHRRIKILKKSGFDYGDVVIYFHRGDNLEYIRDLEAQIILPTGEKIALKNRDFFIEKINDYWSVYKFSLPNITEGAIIEYRYYLHSQYMTEIRAWYFQEAIPVRYSEYRVANSSTFSYVSLFEGGEYMDQIEGPKGTTIFKKGDTRLEIENGRYLIVNAPALKPEAYITTMNDYRPRVRFQLSEYYNYRLGKQEKNMSTWPELAEELLETPSFGEQFLRKKNFKKLLEATEGLVSQGQTEQEKAAIIYNFLAQNLTWNERYGIFAMQELDKAFVTKQGNAAELNLMCLALLNAYEIKAMPLLTSTRSHGKMTDVYPLMDQFNHVLVLVVFSDGSNKILDVSDNMLPMGLPRVSALNRKGWVVDKEKNMWIAITPPICRDFVGLSAKLTEDGNLEGRIKASFHNYSAYAERKGIKNDPKGSFWDDRLGNGSEKAKIEELSFQDLENIDEKLSSSANFSIAGEATVMDDFIYFTPLIYSSFEENPFKSENRQYPVDFAYPFEERVIIDIEFPEGYTIEEVPEPVTIALPDGGAQFQFSTRQVGEKVQIMSLISISKTQFVPKEYQELKKLFDQMIEKQGEQIVLKKKT